LFQRVAPELIIKLALRSPLPMRPLLLLRLGFTIQSILSPFRLSQLWGSLHSLFVACPRISSFLRISCPGEGVVAERAADSCCLSQNPSRTLRLSILFEHLVPGCRAGM